MYYFHLTFSCNWGDLENWQPGIWFPINTIYGIYPTVLDLVFALKGCPLEKKLVTNSELGASYSVIIGSLISLVFLSDDMLSHFVSPFQSFMHLLHKFSTHGGIHVCLLGTKVQIDRESGFLTIHQIVWTKPCSCTSCAIVHIH